MLNVEDYELPYLLKMNMHLKTENLNIPYWIVKKV